MAISSINQDAYVITSMVTVDLNEKDKLLTNKHQFSVPYFRLDQLEYLKKKIEEAIVFAKNNDIHQLNTDHMISVIDERKRKRIEKVKSKSKIKRVYLMHDSNTGYYKIGFSKKPIRREKTLQSEKPTIDMIAHWAGSLQDEKALHLKYRAKRIRGEWFRLTQQDVDDILSSAEGLEKI